ncbi:MAG: tetratricopeptide repeat protein [Roseiflexus sp.]
MQSLLQKAAHFRQQGDTRRARALLRMLATRCPDNPWVWRALADVAEHENERRTALRRVVALVKAASASIPEPNAAARPPVPASTPAPLAQPSASPAPLSASRSVPPPAASPPQPSTGQSSSATPRLTSPAPPSASRSVPPPAASPPQPSAGQSSSATPRPTSPPAAIPAKATSESATTVPPFISRYRPIGIAGVGVAVLIFVMLLANSRWLNTAARTEPDLPSGTPEPVVGATLPASSPAPMPLSPVVSAAPPGTPPLATLAPTDPPRPTATVTLLPTSTPVPTLAAGTVILRDAWTLTLLRPDHALALNGPIGAQQPKGRFVLTLVAVANNGATPTPAPPELFALIDARGNRYAPDPALSAFYLETFGRGRYGDFSLDEAIPVGIGQVSVPVIFDVPVDASGLTLHLGESVAGWPVIGSP